MPGQSSTQIHPKPLGVFPRLVLLNKTKKAKTFLKSKTPKTPFSPQGFLSSRYLGHDRNQRVAPKRRRFFRTDPGQHRTVLWVLFHQPSLRGSNWRAQLAAYPTGGGPWWLPLPSPTPQSLIRSCGRRCVQKLMCRCSFYRY